MMVNGNNSLVSMKTRSRLSVGSAMDSAHGGAQCGSTDLAGFAFGGHVDDILNLDAAVGASR